MTEQYFVKSLEGKTYEITDLLPSQFHDLFIKEEDIREHIQAQLEFRRREGKSGDVINIAPVYVSYNDDRYKDLVKILTAMIPDEVSWPETELSISLNPAGSNIIVVINASKTK